MGQVFTAILGFCIVLLLFAVTSEQDKREARRHEAEDARTRKRQENLQDAVSYRAMLNREQMLREREKWEV